MEQTLMAILNTLNGITVQGKDNLDRLLGSIQALEGILNALMNDKESEKGEEVNG